MRFIYCRVLSFHPRCPRPPPPFSPPLTLPSPPPPPTLYLFCHRPRIPDSLYVVEVAVLKVVLTGLEYVITGVCRDYRLKEK